MIVFPIVTANNKRPDFLKSKRRVIISLVGDVATNRKGRRECPSQGTAVSVLYRAAPMSSASLAGYGIPIALCGRPSVGEADIPWGVCQFLKGF